MRRRSRRRSSILAGAGLCRRPVAAAALRRCRQRLTPGTAHLAPAASGMRWWQLPEQDSPALQPPAALEEPARQCCPSHRHPAGATSAPASRPWRAVAAAGQRRCCRRTRLPFRQRRCRCQRRLLPPSLSACRRRQLLCPTAPAAPAPAATLRLQLMLRHQAVPAGTTRAMQRGCRLQWRSSHGASGPAGQPSGPCCCRRGLGIEPGGHGCRPASRHHHPRTWAAGLGSSAVQRQQLAGQCPAGGTQRGDHSRPAAAAGGGATCGAGGHACAAMWRLGC